MNGVANWSGHLRYSAFMFLSRTLRASRRARRQRASTAPLDPFRFPNVPAAPRSRARIVLAAAALAAALPWAGRAEADEPRVQLGAYGGYQFGGNVEAGGAAQRISADIQ